MIKTRFANLPIGSIFKTGKCKCMKIERIILQRKFFYNAVGLENPVTGLLYHIDLNRKFTFSGVDNYWFQSDLTYDDLN